MGLPIATTTITVARPSDGDPTDAPTFTPLASRHPAVIAAPSGSGNPAGGVQEVVDAQLRCDVLALAPADVVTDEVTGDTYAVVWARQRVGLGLDHTTAGLRKVTGATGG